MKNIFQIATVFIFLAALTLYCSNAMAQTFPGDPGDTNPFEGLPIDGGLIYLLVSALSFGIIKLRRRKKG